MVRRNIASNLSLFFIALFIISGCAQIPKIALDTIDSSLKENTLLIRNSVTHHRGTAFRLGGRYLLSAQHVTEGNEVGSKFVIRSRSRTVMIARMMGVNEEYDVAVLDLLPHYRRNQEHDWIKDTPDHKKLEHGDILYMLCSPITGIEPFRIFGAYYVDHEVKVFDWIEKEGRLEVIQVAVGNFVHGCSGGLLINKHNEVIGMIIAASSEKILGHYLFYAYAVPIDKVLENVRKIIDKYKTK